MATDQECMDYARECVRLAELTKDDLELRDHLLSLAREWMATAMHERKVPEPKSRPA
ncbi:MAG TPA: hypothetical protein VH397_12315 [Xanthobacteraceae bacterium]|jgi:hypothetical protein